MTRSPQPPDDRSSEPISVTVPTPDGLHLSMRVFEPSGPSPHPTQRTIVLAHGGGQTHHSWGSTARSLAASGQRVVTYDLRGHGDSQWSPHGDYSHPAFGRDSAAVAAWCEEPVIWVGASLGGISGLMGITSEPSVFRAMVLVDITNRPSIDGVERILTFMQADLEHGFASLDEAADAVAAYQPHRQRPKSTAGLAKNLRQGDDGRWRWHWDPAFLNSRPPSDMPSDHWSELDDACAQMTVPTLLIRGQLSELVTDKQVAAFLELVPHATSVNVADAAHMIAGDKNDIFTAAVLDFVLTLS